MDPIKILVADDERDITDVMSKKLKQEGYDVAVAYDGIEAWEQVLDFDPDVVVLDLNMPGINGFEVLKKIRENPFKTKWQPVIIVSARGELTDLRKSYALEADHYIVKPCQMKDLLNAIRLMVNLIPKHKQQEESSDVK